MASLSLTNVCKVYPNGFEIEFVQYAGLITVTTNMPLTPDGHGGYIAPTDK